MKYLLIATSLLVASCGGTPAFAGDIGANVSSTPNSASVGVGVGVGTVGVTVAAPAHARVGFSLSSLETATLADLQAADADAKAHNDVFASQCYEGVASYVQVNPISVPTINVIGVASAFQTARDGVKLVETIQAQTAIPPALVQACGPLALDVQNDLGKVAVGGFSIFGLHF